MAAQTIPVTPEELEAEAAAIARRQNTTVAELKRPIFTIINLCLL